MSVKREKQKRLSKAAGCLAAFVLWTAAVTVVDVQTIGPMGSSVGLATINGFVHRLTGVHMALYVMMDWLSLVPAFFMLGFACLGLAQWIRRKSIALVDRSILALGGFYVLVLAAYVLFEVLVINYRPVLIEGALEASYPSSTTLLVLSVMPTLLFQINRRAHSIAVKRMTAVFVVLFSAFMVIGRLIAGVHWLSDIVGSVLLSAGLYLLYRSTVLLIDSKKQGGTS